MYILLAGNYFAPTSGPRKHFGAYRYFKPSQKPDIPNKDKTLYAVSKDLVSYLCLRGGCERPRDKTNELRASVVDRLRVYYLPLMVTYLP